MERPLFSVCELSLPGSTFMEDLKLCTDLGLDGISVDEKKIDGMDYRRLHQDMRAAGIRASVCAPRTLSILPSAVIPGRSQDPEERIQDICSSIAKFAVFQPATVFIATGPAGAYDERSARSLVVKGLQAAGKAAAQAGVTLSIEPMRPAHRETWSTIFSLPDALELIDEVGEDIKITYDIWHLWISDDIVNLTRRHAGRLAGVQVSDYRWPTRSGADRILPGQGIIPFPALLGALEQGGFGGWYDLEVFSDVSFPDSVWKRDPHEWVAEGFRGFLAAWERRN